MQKGRRLQHLFLGSVCALGGAACVSLFWFVEETHKDYGKRWLVALFGCMLLAAGFQFLKELFRADLSPELDELINSVARTVMYGGFGVLAVAGAVGTGGGVRGGLPFVPGGVNEWLGRGLFAVVGVALCAVGLYCLVQAFNSLRKYLASKSA